MTTAWMEVMGIFWAATIDCLVEIHGIDRAEAKAKVDAKIPDFTEKMLMEGPYYMASDLMTAESGAEKIKGIDPDHQDLYASILNKYRAQY